MNYSLGDAAKATGKAKSTVLRAIKTGRISASKENGAYKIEPSELFRVFDATVAQQVQSNETQPAPEHPEKLRLRLDSIQEERERERAQMQATIDDLRSRLDRSENRITALLADQRVPEARRRWWWQRRR